MRYSNQLEAIDPMEEGVRRELLSEKFTVLPHSSSLEPTVMVFSVRRHWPPNCTDRDVLKGIIYQLDAALLDEQTQEQGLTVIYDMTDAKYSNFGADLSMKLLNLLVGSYPARVRNILIVAAPFWFRPPYHLSRFFVNDKIRERILTIDRKQLPNYLPLATIPQNLGGYLIHCHVDWLKTCFERHFASPFPNGDYFNPMKAIQVNGRTPFTLTRRSSFHGALLREHHFPHYRQGAYCSNGTLRLHNRFSSVVGRTKSVTSKGNPKPQRQLKPRRAAEHFLFFHFVDASNWTYNPLVCQKTSHLPELPALSFSTNNDSACDELVTLPATNSNSTTCVSVEQFVADFPRKFPGVFEREFEQLIKPTPLNGSVNRFKCHCNSEKNRYVDVPCLDQSAVILPNGAYIHANYVDGYNRKNAYILTQGPLDNTIDDFWQMIWTTGATIIIMLTKIVENGRIKCSQYWPALDPSNPVSAISHFAHFTVTNVSETVEANGLYQVTKLQLSKSQDKISTDSIETRQIDHFLFLGWPDFDVPKDPRGFLSFLDVVNERLKQNPNPNPPPLVIHCSAGIGRTGTFTATDICLMQAKTEGAVDVLGVVTRIRNQRACSVQLAKQYSFIYQSIYMRLTEISRDT
ncbi:unnamed protein product [Mesocestoides corti]|uniref:Protein-tyrosine-phosphatase n=2 Tax=Mesocestoides corti TaxID=53468 RepID=A0A158QUW0_MESCO|nr:unnamed protein product [Mesocestoides corti]